MVQSRRMACSVCRPNGVVPCTRAAKPPLSQLTLKSLPTSAESRTRLQKSSAEASVRTTTGRASRCMFFEASCACRLRMSGSELEHDQRPNRGAQNIRALIADGIIRRRAPHRCIAFCACRIRGSSVARPSTSRARRDERPRRPFTSAHAAPGGNCRRDCN